MTNRAPQQFASLEDIRLRKEQLENDIEQQEARIAALWDSLFVRQEEMSKGEYVAAFVQNSVKAIDAFLLVRRLMRDYGGVLRFFGGAKKKRRK